MSTTTTETERCRVCGKSFSGDSPESARNSAVAHMAASTDEQHSGIGYQKAKQMLELDVEPDGDGVDPEQAEVPEAGGSSSSEESTAREHSSEQTTNPLLEAPDVDESTAREHSSEQTSDDDVDDGTPCPNCGVAIRGYADLDPGDYLCGACDEPFRVPA